ncbi:DUF2062 domain-containing protein [Planktotalea sp.]|uniref:DUF2062 domain-containing protein n=1 Tax=Planktotalea sp. TaxID=2029877 RepID=UPI003D6B419A
MVFKRRNKRSWPRVIWEVIYPKGGWARAFHYVKHRVRRLPDSPERIARGIFVGVFTSFTPFYGLHFLISFVLARVMNANMLAALLATFFGNPLTYVPIAYASLKTGFWITGMTADAEHVRHGFGEMFYGASRDLLFNLKALFTGQPAEWHGLRDFYDDVFFPYMIGGIIPGIVTGLVCYYLSVPVIRAYQKRRNKGVLKARLARLKEKSSENTDQKAAEKS